MTWPREIYVATSGMGVYYTDNFYGPETQPTWTQINTGLPSIDCNSILADPLDPAKRQYVLVGSGLSRVLCRRENGSNWTNILTVQQVEQLVSRPGEGKDISKFCTDTATPGRVWALCRVYDGGWHNTGYVLRSDDYGTTWNVAGIVGDSAQCYGLSGIAAYDNNVYVTASFKVGSLVQYYYSTNYGASFGRVVGWLYQHDPAIINPLTPDRFYSTSDPQGNRDLCCITNTGVYINPLQDGIGPQRRDAMWFDPLMAGHQRAIRYTNPVGESSRIYTTNDAWETIASTTMMSQPLPICFSAYSGTDVSEMLVGLMIYGNTHAVGVIYGEGNPQAIGIAGNNTHVSPYTDSIPDVCGTVVGVVGINPMGSVYTYAISTPEYTGSSVGIPEHGDRAAFDTVNYPEVHALDILNETLFVHVKKPTGARHVAISDALKTWKERLLELEDIPDLSSLYLTPTAHMAIGNNAPHHAPVTLGAGSDIALTLVGQELTLANVLTPAEHSAIGNGSPHHAPVTLSADAEALLQLSTQALGLADFIPHGILIGPDATSPDTPEVRPLVKADLPTMTADDIGVDASGFSNNLGPTDTTVQKALDTLDDMLAMGMVAASDPLWHIDGRLVPLEDAAPAYVLPRDATITAVYILCADTGTASTTIVDIHLNGTTIFTDQDQRPALAHDDADGVASGTPDVTAVTAGDKLSLDLDAVATGATGLTVLVALEVGNPQPTILRQSIFTFSGNLSVMSNPLKVYNCLSTPQTLTKVVLAVDTAPLNTDIIADIYVDGVSIFTDPDHRPRIAAGSTVGSTINIDNPTWNADAFLTTSVVQTGTGTPGADLVIHITHC